MRGAPHFFQGTARPATVAAGAVAIGLVLLMSGSTKVVYSAEGAPPLLGTITSSDGKRAIVFKPTRSLYLSIWSVSSERLAITPPRRTL